MAMVSSSVAMAAWTSPFGEDRRQQQQQQRVVLDAQPEPTSTKRWDVLMIAIDDLRSQLSCSGPKGFDSHAMHTPHLCELAQDSLMLLRSQVRPWPRSHAPHTITYTRTHTVKYAVALSGNYGDLRAFACVDPNQSAPVDDPCL